jgi:hypothetical protein
MKPVALAAAACLALSACQTTNIDAAVGRSLSKACAALNTAYAGFSAVAATGAVKARTVAKVDAAYAGVAIVCTDPANATAADALVRVIAASAVVAAALKEAR